MDRYGAYLGATATIPASPTANVAPPGPRTLGSEVAIRPPVTQAPPPSTPTNAPPAGTATYRVPAGGLLVSQVAQQQLGDALRWIDIYRLNPSIDPAQPLREGTELRIPAR
jgi:hypothetical protein